MAHVPTPFVDRTFLTQLFDDMSFFSAVTGSGLSSLSWTSIGITPYITASIIMQLLSAVFRPLEQMQQGMKDDRDRYDKITVGLGIALGIFQAALMAAVLGRQGLLYTYAWYSVLLVASFWCFGSVIEIMAGKIMSDRYFGKTSGIGISLILCANILSSYPSDIVRMYAVIKNQPGRKQILAAGVWIVVPVLMVILITYIHGCELRLPVSYSGKARGEGRLAAIEKEVSNIPVRLAPGGVIPVIFASSLISMPSFFQSVLGKNWEWANYLGTSYWFDTANMKYSIGAIFYVLLIFAFSYYYAGLEMNPAYIAETLRRRGGMIADIRPGKETEDYIRHHMRFTAFIGASALSIVALIPVLLAQIYKVSGMAFLGTSVIITTDVILDMKDRIAADKIESRYIRHGKYSIWLKEGMS